MKYNQHFDTCTCKMTCLDNRLKMARYDPMDATEVDLPGNRFEILGRSHSFIGRKNLKVVYLNNSNIESIHLIFYTYTFTDLGQQVRVEF